MGVFLVVEKEDALLLIDQHAAHERILFDRFMTKAKKAAPLLVPYRVTTNSPEDDLYIEENRDALAAAGVRGKKVPGTIWEFSSVSAFWDGTEADFAQDLLVNRIEGTDLVRSLAATSACRAAAKEGDYLDDESAAALASQVMAMGDPRCPHGRPIILTFTRDELYRLIRRTK
jgi:DNA mismatch repair protein MutL